VKQPFRRGPLLALVCALAASGSARGDSGTFRVDADLTSARFAVQYLGFARAQGRFGQTSGTIIVDPQQKVDSIDLVIDTRSVDMGWDLRDAFLRSEVMFDTQRFPQMRFHSTHLTYEGARLVGVDGEVTLRGVMRPVRLEVRHIECGTRPEDGRETCGASVAGHISRGAFGMDFAYPLIGDDVELDFAVTAFRVRDAGEAKTP
jgi:polyisoprenoid-binding protein YceI